MPRLLVAGRQQVLDRGERRRLHEVDHDRRGEHMHAAAADPRRRVLLAHQDFRRSLGADRKPGQVDHAGSSDGPTIGPV